MHRHIVDQHRAAWYDSERYVRIRAAERGKPESSTEHCASCEWSVERCHKEVQRSGTVCCLRCDHKR